MRALAGAAQDFGISADTALGSVQALKRAMDTNPGNQAWIRSFGVHLRDAHRSALCWGRPAEGWSANFPNGMRPQMCRRGFYFGGALLFPRRPAGAAQQSTAAAYPPSARQYGAGAALIHMA